MFPEYVCDISAQNTPQIIYYIILNMPILSGRCFSACLFKCKWAVAPRPLFQNMAVPLHLISDNLHICLDFIIMSIALKSWVLKPYQFKLLIYSFLSAQKAAVTQHLSTKLSSFSSLIALKLSNTHKFMLKSHIKQSVMSEKVNSRERNYMLVLDLCIK